MLVITKESLNVLLKQKSQHNLIFILLLASFGFEGMFSSGLISRFFQFIMKVYSGINSRTSGCRLELQVH